MSTADTLHALIQQRRTARDLDLRAAELASTNLSGLRADAVALHRADLRGVNLSHARLTACPMEEATLEEADFSEAVLRLCSLDGARAAGARFKGARLEDSSARGAQLSRADLSGARLSESSFARASLRGARLERAEGDGVELRGADLSGASLVEARLLDADFRGADLSGADLSRARLHGADFRGAILDGVRWTDADTAGARFDERSGPERARVETEEAPPAAAPADPARAASELLAWIDGLTESAVRVSQGEAARAPAPPQLAALFEGMDPAQARAFVATLAQALPGRGVTGLEAIEPLTELLSSLEGATGDEPPEALQAWLEQLLPEGVRGSGEASASEAVERLLERLGIPPKNPNGA